MVQRPRLADVAARVGMSPASVSLVLRGVPGPSAETRDRGDRQTSAPVVPLAVERRPGTLAGEVRALNQAFRLGLFDAAMFERAEALLEQTKTVDPTRDPVLLKARSIVAAIMDQQGRGDLAREAVKEGDAVFDIVRSAPDEPSAAVPSGPEPALLREQIRFVAEHARMHLYRQARFLLARERLVSRLRE